MTYLQFCKDHIAALTMVFIAGGLLGGALFIAIGQFFPIAILSILGSLPWAWLWSLIVDHVIKATSLPIPWIIYLWGVFAGDGINVMLFVSFLWYSGSSVRNTSSKDEIK